MNCIIRIVIFRHLSHTLGSEASSNPRQNAFIDQTVTTDGTHDAKLSVRCQSPALSNLYVLCGTRLKQADYTRSVVLPQHQDR